MLAIQGGGYVVAGLAMLIWLRDGAGPSGPGGDDAARGDDQRALVMADEGIRLLPSSAVST